MINRLRKREETMPLAGPDRIYAQDIVRDGVTPSARDLPKTLWISLPSWGSNRVPVAISWMRRPFGGHQPFLVCPSCHRRRVHLDVYEEGVDCDECAGVRYHGNRYHRNLCEEQVIRSIEATLKEARRAQAKRGANRNPQLDDVVEILQRSFAEVEGFMTKRATDLQRLIES